MVTEVEHNHCYIAILTIYRGARAVWSSGHMSHIQLTYSLESVEAIMAIVVNTALGADLLTFPYVFYLAGGKMSGTGEW